MAYERHEDLIAPARTRPELWRLLVGIVLSVGISLALILLLMTVIYAIYGAWTAESFVKEIQQGGTKRATLFLLLTIPLLAAGPVILCRPLHGRSFRSLFGPIGRGSLDFLVAARGLVILYVILFLIPGGPVPERVMGFGEWAILLPLSLAVILLQTASEELIFRGYLQSELAARFRSPIVWMVLPSLLFAVGHYSPQEHGENAALIASLAFVFGLIAADLTARTGTIGAALAFHFIGNTIAITVVSTSGPLSGLALYQYPFGMDDTASTTPLLWLDLGVMAVAWLTIRLSLRV